MKGQEGLWNVWEFRCVDMGKRPPTPTMYLYLCYRKQQEQLLVGWVEAAHAVERLRGPMAE